MEYVQRWRGRIIEDGDKELADHLLDILAKQYIPYALADEERAKSSLLMFGYDDAGNEYKMPYDPDPRNWPKGLHEKPPKVG